MTINLHLFSIMAWGLGASLIPAKEPERGERVHGRGFVEAFIEKADLDRDGVISLDEFMKYDRLTRLPEEKRREIFARLDKDGDGSLKKEELKRMRPERGRRPMPRLKELDVNQDGGVDFEEFTASPMVSRLSPEQQRRFFDRLDRDSDGLLTPRDHPEHGHLDRGDRRGPHPLDRDGDGFVSFDEFRKSPRIRDLSEDEQEERFEALDKNGDLRLDRSELSWPPNGPGSGRKPREEGC